MKRALGACVVVMLAAACSGGSSGPTKAEFVRQANRVCRNAAAQISTLRIPGRADVASMPQAAAEVVAVQRRYLDRLRDVPAPKQDQPEISKWIALIDQTIDQAEVSAESQQDGDIARALTANLNGAALDRRADELAQGYGLDDCVRATAPPPTTSTTRPGA